MRKDTVKSFTANEDIAKHENPMTRLVENSEYENEYTYYDPLGFKGRKKNELEEIYESTKDVIKEGAEIAQSQDPYASMIKNLTTDSMYIPIDTSPEVRLSVVQDKPLATMLPRNAVNTKKQRYNEVVDIVETSSFAEDGTIPDPQPTDNIVKHEYSIERGYGRKYQVTDLMMLAGDTLSPRSVKESAIVESMDRFEERQALEGTVNGDSNSFEGLRNWAQSFGVEDTYTGDITPKDLRAVINEMDKRGVDENNMMLVVDHDTHMELRNQIDDRIRLEPAGELNDGFETLVYDGVPVMKSHGATDGSIYAVNTAECRFNMLAGTEVKPLPVEDTSAEWAIYRYGQFITQKKYTCVIYDQDNS